MKTEKKLLLLLLAASLPAVGFPEEIQIPPPVIRVVDLRADEKPVAVEQSETVVAENAFFRRVRTTFTFTNPNPRVMAGEFEFPIPEEAFVCGYFLQIGDEMVPGVVCEKEKARVAFENEVRKGVDPGIVEQVKGNVWKTRIFPLNANVPRKAVVDYVAPKADDAAAGVIYERDGDDVFAACAGEGDAKVEGDRIAGFSKGSILWDASMSAKPLAAAWRKKLESLPETGEWLFIPFRNKPDEARAFASRAELCAAIDALDYDGGTDIGRALECSGANSGSPVLLFTDEIDTMGLENPGYEEISCVIIASRGDAPRRPVEVRRLAKDEQVPEGVEVKDGALLATVWAARRMQDLSSQSGARKDEFLSLGRRYGVAGPGLSLIVLETLDQWLEHKIEPPANLAIHDEWVRRRAAEDDPIADKRARAEHEKELLRYWEERVKWWNDPKPPKKTPKSGVFDNVVSAVANVFSAGAPGSGAAERSGVARARMASEPAADGAMELCEELCEEPEAAPSPAPAPGVAGSGASPVVTLKPWDPKTPYIDALGAAEKGEAYRTYLKERETYGGSPAFYLDCAGWFYKAGENTLADRILSNLAEFKLEDAALWRSMGWRAREAGSYGLAVLAFRKALRLRGEEGQSSRDLALVLSEAGKEAKDVAMLEEALKLLANAAFKATARRSGRRGNDFQVSVISLEELNGLISWVNAVEWGEGGGPAIPEFDAAYRRDLPVKLRIVMSWDADETDIDLHVLEPNGEEAFYGNRRTAEGGFVSEDVTTGYGPEEYMKKELEQGTYKVLSNYYASHQTALTGATTVTATVYTDWGTAAEKRLVLTMRLDKPKSKHFIGEVTL
jgi:tetratricopeptide (TPR) repeat protein